MPKPNGAKIRSLRWDLGYCDTEDFAKSVKISRKHLLGIESGHNFASPRVLHRIATRLRVKVSDLLPDDEVTAGAA